MYDNVDEIYSFLGQAMYNVLPDSFIKANTYTVVNEVDSGIFSFLNEYVERESQKTLGFRFSRDDITNVVIAYQSLYKIMQKNEQDVPWNKARFEITSEGDFTIDFKYDEDFAWYKSLDIDSQEYDDLDIKVINSIKSWQGLPEDYPRYWKAR